MSETVVTAIVLLIAGCYGLVLAGCALVEMCAALAASREAAGDE